MAEWTDADARNWAEVVSSSLFRRAMAQLEEEIAGKLDRLATVDLATDVHGAVKLQAQVAGMRRTLDLFNDLAVEKDDG